MRINQTASCIGKRSKDFGNDLNERFHSDVEIAIFHNLFTATVNSAHCLLHEAVHALDGLAGIVK